MHTHLKHFFHVNAFTFLALRFSYHVFLYREDSGINTISLEKKKEIKASLRSRQIYTGLLLPDILICPSYRCIQLPYIEVVLEYVLRAWSICFTFGRNHKVVSGNNNLRLTLAVFFSCHSFTLVVLSLLVLISFPPYS